jgi:hypothetical protein
VRFVPPSDARQAEAVFARFPGPASLFTRRRAKLVSFAICLFFTVFFAWLLFANPTRSQYRSYDWIMIPISFVFFAVFMARGVIMLLVPGIGSLTLDPQGFAIRLTFRTERLSWRDVVRDFRDETTYWPPGKLGGGLRQITFEVIAPGARRGGTAKVKRALNDVYELRPDELAWLMNEWRRQALALAASRRPASTTIVPRIGVRP